MSASFELASNLHHFPVVTDQYVKVSNVGGGAAPGDVESMRKDLDKILGRDEHGTAQVSMVVVVVVPQIEFFVCATLQWLRSWTMFFL